MLLIPEPHLGQRGDKVLGKRKQKPLYSVHGSFLVPAWGPHIGPWGRSTKGVGSQWLPIQRSQWTERLPPGPRSRTEWKHHYDEGVLGWSTPASEMSHFPVDIPQDVLRFRRALEHDFVGSVVQTNPPWETGAVQSHSSWASGYWCLFTNNLTEECWTERLERNHFQVSNSI